MNIQRIPIGFQAFDKIKNEDTESNLLKVKLRVVNVGTNLNNSHFSKEAIQSAEKSLSNIPILGYIKYDNEDNALDFDGHNIITNIVKDENGFSVERKYLEQPIGVIPESNNITYETYNDKEYLCCEGYIWKSYANEGYGLIMSSDEKSISMEIKVLEGDMDNKTKIFDISSFEFLGVTVLGDDVNPGIEDANLTKCFSMNNYKLAIQEICKEIFSMKGESKVDVVEKDTVEEEVIETKEEVVEVIEEAKEEALEEIKETKEKVLEEIKEAKEEAKEETKEEEEEVTEDFSLSSVDMEKIIRIKLKDRLIPYTDEWGETYDVQEYWLVDILPTEKIIIVEEQITRKNVGLSYELVNDDIIIDFESKKEYICEWREKIVSTTETDQTVDSADGKFEFIQNRYNNKIELLMNELKELKSFKEKIDNENYKIELDEIVADFSLSEEEVQQLKVKALSKEISKEDFKKELYVLQGMKAVEEMKNRNFSKVEDNEQKEEIVTRVLTQQEETKSAYGDLDRYLEKK